MIIIKRRDIFRMYNFYIPTSIIYNIYTIFKRIFSHVRLLSWGGRRDWCDVIVDNDFVIVVIFGSNNTCIVSIRLRYTELFEILNFEIILAFVPAIVSIRLVFLLVNKALQDCMRFLTDSLLLVLFRTSTPRCGGNLALLRKTFICTVGTPAVDGTIFPYAWFLHIVPLALRVFLRDLAVYPRFRFRFPLFILIVFRHAFQWF